MRNWKKTLKLTISWNIKSSKHNPSSCFPARIKEFTWCCSNRAWKRRSQLKFFSADTWSKHRSDGNSQSKPMMLRSQDHECGVCRAHVNTRRCAGSLCSGTRSKNHRPPEIQKWPYWPTPCLVLVIFPGTRTHPWLTQIQYTYTFICFVAAGQSQPEKKTPTTKVNTQRLKRTVCLLPLARHTSVWKLCILIPEVDHIVRVAVLQINRNPLK